VNAPSANTLYKAARDLINAGQPVFPCRPTDSVVNGRERFAKSPLTKNGWQDATLDLDQVKRWWRARGDSAIGIPTGVMWDVLDVDVKNESDGRKHLPYLNRLGLLDGCKRVVKTPSGGWHLYFKAAPEGILTNKAHAGLGLDVRSHGGYVLAAPSYIETVGPDEVAYAGSYTDVGETTGSVDKALHWDLIVATLAPINADNRKPIELLGYERQSSLASLRGWLSERVAGERNNALHWAVCRCIDNRLDPHELMDVALLIGLGEEEALLTIDSAIRRAGVSVDELDTEAEALFPSGS